MRRLGLAIVLAVLFAACGARNPPRPPPVPPPPRPVAGDPEMVPGATPPSNEYPQNPSAPFDGGRPVMLPPPVTDGGLFP
jgi:hypothetical protein